MNQVWTGLTARLPTRRWNWAFVATTVVVLAVVISAWLMSNNNQRAISTVVPTSPAIEAKWGVRITQVAVTADGGMVDFRFAVLDANKAADMMLDVNNLPVLIDENRGITLSSTVEMGDSHDLNVGQTYFLLYRNAEGAVRPGSFVTVKFGSLTLKHVPVR